MHNFKYRDHSLQDLFSTFQNIYIKQVGKIYICVSLSFQCGNFKMVTNSTDLIILN